jgi:hypothetical protein
MGLRLFLSLIYLWVTLWPAHASARWGAARPDTSQYKFNHEELKFIVAYKSFTKSILHIQASETKKKLICLGWEHLTGLDLSSDVMFAMVQAYKSSEECQKFLNEEVPKIILAFSEMRINLALHKSSQNEILHMQHNGYLGQRTDIPIDCDSLESPLGYGSTQFCFGRIQTILDTTPKHILKKFSFKPLDSVFNGWFGHSDLPEVVNLPPLTWEEVLVGTDIFHGYYTNNSHNLNSVLDELSRDYDQEVLDTLTERQKRWSEDIVTYHRNVRHSQTVLANYYTALDYQAHGAHVFSDYPENSAPRAYMEIISQHPVLAFYEPNLKTADLDCRSEEIASNGVTALCERYIESLPRDYNSGISFSLSRSRDIYPKLALAYQKVLNLNRKLIESLDIKYNTEVFFNDQGVLLDDANLELVSNWSDLLSMDASLNTFLDIYPDYNQGQKDKFLRIRGRQELFTLGLMIGGAVGAGFACGMMGGWPLLICLGAAGAGVNMAFYADTLYRHNNLMIKYFSTSSHETSEGLKLGLIEFESYKSEVQMLILDTLLLGVGTSAGRMTRLSRELVTGAQRQIAP